MEIHPNGVKCEADRVVFYLRGLRMVIAVVLAFWLAIAWWLWAGTGELGIGGWVLSATGCLVLVSVTCRAVAAAWKRPLPLVVHEKPLSQESGDVHSWPACKVTRIVVAERAEARYAPLVQLLLEMRGEDHPVIALQRNLVFRRRVTRVAEYLGARWNTDVFIVPRATPPMACSVIGAGIACVIMSVSGWLAWKEHVVASWPQAPGVLASFDLGVHGPGPNGGFEYADPHAEYEYMVDGVQYRSTSVKPSPFHYWSRKSLERDFASMTPGARVVVHFHPTAPEKSYLVAAGVGAGTTSLGILGAGLMLLVAMDAWFRRR
jgi:hypothetical protein